MSRYDESRSPHEVNGPTPNILWLHSTKRNETDVLGFLTYVFAANTNLIDGEPIEITQARNNLEAAYKVAVNFRDRGVAAMFPPHIDYALRISGWVK